MTPEEICAAHLNGHCHDGAACPICKAWQAGRDYGRQEATRSIAEG